MGAFRMTVLDNVEKAEEDPEREREFAEVLSRNTISVSEIYSSAFTVSITTVCL